MWFLGGMPRARSLIVATDGELVVKRDPDRAAGRLLRQDGMDASYVDLGDARHLEFDYQRWIRLVLQSFRVERVVHIGGAACTLARALLAESPRSRQEVIEIDERLFAIARAHLGLRRQPGLKLRVGDGREVIAARRGVSADAIVIDAFVGARVPKHLVTRQALAECAGVAPLTVVNVVDTAGLAHTRAIAAGLGETYEHVAAVGSSAKRGGNIVLFGSASQPNYRRIEGAAAADASAARVLRAQDLAGGAAWLD
jgi:hypothetical protein